jgi:hypothetical protein
LASSDWSIHFYPSAYLKDSCREIYVFQSMHKFRMPILNIKSIIILLPFIFSFTEAFERNGDRSENSSIDRGSYSGEHSRENTDYSRGSGNYKDSRDSMNRDDREHSRENTDYSRGSSNRNDSMNRDSSHGEYNSRSTNSSMNRDDREYTSRGDRNTEGYRGNVNGDYHTRRDNQNDSYNGRRHGESRYGERPYDYSRANDSPRHGIAGVRDSSTGLSLGTVNLISRLPRCKQNVLLNYRHLLQRPAVRMQFFRDLYQREQKNAVRGCGELLYRDRAMLLRDPYFRRQVYKMMKKRSSMSAAIQRT